MSSQIEFTLANIGMLFGVEGIDLLIDGESQANLQFGETVTLEVDPGERTVQTVLHGVIDRRSKPLNVSALAGGHVTVVGKYSRLWGNIKLKLSQGR